MSYNPAGKVKRYRNRRIRIGHKGQTEHGVLTYDIPIGVNCESQAKHTSTDGTLKVLFIA